MTKVLSHAEFEKLVADEYGDTMPRPFLIQSFEAEEMLAEGFDWEPKKAALKAVTLNVSETCMYTDRKGQVMAVVPVGYLSYDAIERFFPAKKAWAYAISDTVGAELDERAYFFRHGTNDSDGNVSLPKFDITDITTH